MNQEDDPFAPPSEEERFRDARKLTPQPPDDARGLTPQPPDDRAHTTGSFADEPGHLDAVDGAASTWQRTSPRQLVVAPARALANLALPLVIVTVGAGIGGGGGGRGITSSLTFLVPVALLVVLGSLVPWLGTRWRIADGRLQQRYRVLSTKQTSVALERVRSVDLESTLMHRALGLSVVKIGTGVDDERVSLDSLPKDEALELQEFLLHRSAELTPGTDAAADPSAESREGRAAPAPARREVLARLDWSWLKFAPLQVSQLVVLAAAFGLFFQVADDLPIDQQQVADALEGQVVRFGVLVVVAVGLAVGVIAYLLAAVAAYAVRWGGLTVSRDAENLRVEAGLLTTRSVTVEQRRVRGLQLVEPALVRLASGAQLSALATGVGSGGTTQVLPSCPRGVAVDVGEQVLGASAALSATLHRHGPAARRRRHVRAQLLAVPTAAALVGLTIADLVPPWLLVLGALLVPLGAGLAELSYRHLGHTLTGRHLVSRTGLLGTTRTVLEREGIIGWRVTQTWFQRRVGLCTLVAATAAGSERVEVVDVRLEVALGLTRQVTPALVQPFAAA